MCWQDSGGGGGAGGAVRRGEFHRVSGLRVESGAWTELKRSRALISKVNIRYYFGGSLHIILV